MASNFGFRQPSVMPAAHSFARVPSVSLPRSRFNRSSGYKTTFDASMLVPVFLDEVLPGDTMSLNPTFFARLATPLHPVMDNLHLDTFFFFVPSRLLWDNWQRFMGERDPDPDSSIDFIVPRLAAADNDDIGEESIYDYFGIPTKVAIPATDPGINALPFRAYNLIYNEWFRDQNLVDSVSVPTGDGPDPLSTYTLLRRGKRHDYFTSALPWPQKGPAVPLFTTSETLPVVGDTSVGDANRILMRRVGTNPQTLGLSATSGSNNAIYNSASTNDGYMTWAEGVSIGAVADMSGAVNTINAFRQAYSLQRFLEKDARGGSRYTEILLNHFGVVSPDARLQRPEFLGGGSSPVSVNPVAATAGGDTAVGDLGAVGLATSQKGGFHKSFVEHGYVIGLVSVRADLTYQQGLPRLFGRRTRYDFYWPVFAHLGEQAVNRYEIFYSDGGADAMEVFGYQERYAEYRYKPSMITGQFRSNAVLSLDTWHLSQDFADAPVLSQSFIEENVPMARVLAVPEQPDFLLDAYFSLKHARVMPTYSVPGLGDRY